MTRLDPRVAEAMEPWGIAGFGNPHSAHLWGYQARAAVELARDGGDARPHVAADRREDEDAAFGGAHAWYTARRRMLSGGVW